ncbi:UNVERIFIED_CONTAM: hypothetical protein Slati_2785300 [Sesamum latifolium]|uniref:Uncharacterized protein n=1 Tax=Sesamum latifolium TaxID=2727402 RepID=A0AAW2W069_9LAMI
MGIQNNPRGSTGESPFSLVYGTEAIIPAELGMPFHRVINFSEECNTELFKESLDLIEELREKAFIRVQRYKNTMINAYNRRAGSSLSSGPLDAARGTPLGTSAEVMGGTSEESSLVAGGAPSSLPSCPHSPGTSLSTDSVAARIMSTLRNTHHYSFESVYSS